MLRYLCMLLLAGSVGGTEPKSLLSNGDFETPNKTKDWPKDWSHPEGATWEVEENNHFIRLKSPKPDQMLMVYRVFDVKPEHLAYELKFRLRATDIKRGKENYHDGRILIDFKDKAGQKVKGGPSAPNVKGTTEGWKEKVIQFKVPEGAAKLEILPCLLDAASGTLDVDDFMLTLITDPAAIEKLGQKAVPTPAPPVGKLPPPAELHVVGNQLQTTASKTVWLQGVNVPSLEWSNTGESILQSIVAATEQWKANVIRLPVSDARWFGKEEGQKDGGESYRKLIDQAVEAASTRGAYVVLDLHRYKAPTEAHVTFWKEAAAHFKNNPAVLFDLLNEPHGISWEIWQKGGTITEKKKDGGEVKLETVGMQKLLDTVRQTGAKNVVVVGGLDWAYDLSGILNGHALTDADGHGIVYATHVYNWKTGWQKSFLDVAAKHPILVGECGCEVDKLSFIPAGSQEAPATWAPDMLGLIQKHQLNWTAWSFHPKASPKLLTGWDYTPTPYWGAHVKAALAGEAFTFTRLR